MSWQNLTLHVNADGSLRDLVALEGGRIADRVAISFSEPWELVAVAVTDDEIEQHWELGPVHAVTRQIFDQAWSLRIWLENTSAEPQEVPAPRLVVDAPWRPEVLAAGDLGYVVLDPGAPFEPPTHLLTLARVKGRCHLDGAELVLTPEPLKLASRGERGERYQVIWRGAWHPHAASLGQYLPEIWPDETVLEQDCPALIDHPDAVVVSETVSLTEGDEDLPSAYLGGVGVHNVWLHDKGGSILTRLHWAPKPESVLAKRGSLILEHVPPWACTISQALIADRATAAGYCSAGQLTEYLQDAEVSWPRELASEAPMALEILVGQANRLDDPARLQQLADAAGRLAPVVGAHSAWLTCALACRIAGTEVPPTPAWGDPTNTKDLASQCLQRAEREVFEASFADQPTPAVWRALGLTGGVLPTQGHSALVRAQALRATKAMPEHWQVAPRLGLEWGEIRQTAMMRLLAEGPSDEVLAWMVW